MSRYSSATRAQCLAGLARSSALLGATLDEAGIDRKAVYVTSAVEHFELERGAKHERRIHTKPTDTWICGCHPWLEEEIKVKSELTEIEIAK